MNRKVLLIGLDCAPPELVFDHWRNALPNIKKLIDGGIYGKLKSTMPPITCPAWMSMLTGKSPGSLGCYGFRSRQGHSYRDISIATSKTIRDETVWDILGKEGKKSIIIGVPQTYPPKPVNGCLITGFLTPGTEAEYTYPKELKGEIEKLVGEYIFDVRKFRTDNKDYVLREVYEMTRKRIKVVKYLLENKPWDFFMWVEIGLDRMHHAFWKYMDPTHKRYEKGSKYENAIKDYYTYLDEEIGEILSLIPDNTVVLVASDHGAKPMDGCICINEWLMKEGYLILKEYPKEITGFDKLQIDWQRTKVWGWGGYYARIFLNLEGRDPYGSVPREEYEPLRDELKLKIPKIADNTEVYRPEELYSQVKGNPPDLMVFFGDLRYRSVASMGYNSIFTPENDTGPDDAMHSINGIFIMYEPDNKIHKKVEGLNIVDVAPAILKLLGIRVPEDMEGNCDTIISKI